MGSCESPEEGRERERKTSFEKPASRVETTTENRSKGEAGTLRVPTNLITALARPEVFVLDRELLAAQRALVLARVRHTYAFSQATPRRQPSLPCCMPFTRPSASPQNQYRNSTWGDECDIKVRSHLIPGATLLEVPRYYSSKFKPLKKNGQLGPLRHVARSQPSFASREGKRLDLA